MKPPNWSLVVGYSEYHVCPGACSRSSCRLAELNIPAQIVHTPGHTDHCVSLLLDSGEVFTGDLPPEPMAFDNPTALKTWRRLRERGATSKQGQRRFGIEKSWSCSNMVE